MSTERFDVYVAFARGQKKVRAICLDDPKYARSTARDVAQWIREGCIIKRMTAAKAQSLEWEMSDHDDA